MDYKQYIRENFPQGAFLPEERIDAFLSYAKDSTVQELERLAEAIQRQPWLAQWYHPRDDIQFQIDHMLRITGSQAITLTHEQGMWEKSRQMLLLEAPGTGSDDTVRGTLYEGWILAQADQMLRSAELAITALPNIMEKMGEPINGLSAAPDNLYWAKDHFVILDAKCPRTPHVSPPDAYVAQLHFYEAALRDLMKKNYPEWADAPIHNGAGTRQYTQWQSHFSGHPDRTRHEQHPLEQCPGPVPACHPEPGTLAHAAATRFRRTKDAGSGKSDAATPGNPRSQERSGRPGKRPERTPAGLSGE
ncbi:hypothetical protein HF670_03880 [Acidithiobacillus thiooxidans]|uniref:hypothetical protein n=1 Tax=Acidithiobacillus thiooxidans TaxID=930 RepID=UPI001C07DDBF|nr:hypothetical protein [Acidithiobacillus thiooxidans]MBU2838715.1 hypothetical protein [Acidithiobacillus thiooxidans]